jgi:hypothetical protein
MMKVGEINMNLQENIRRILKEERNISDIIKIVAKEYNCSTWEINNGYCEDFALNVLEKLGGYEDNLFELSGDMFFNQRDPEFAKENWGDVIETNYGVWSKNLLDYWGYPPNVNLNLVDDEINHVWLFYNGKHYDAEVPEGVDNWFEIPLIKRLFNRYKKNMVQENIRRILKETLESKWNKGNYNYQHGYCHYFAYDIIGKIKKRFPNKKVNYYMILANEVDKYDGAIVQDYLIHVYIQIDNMLLDSNGITTHDKAWEMAEEWEQRQAHLVPDEYETKMWEEESDTIPEMFFNNSFCNTRRVKKDVEEFLNNEIVQRILRDK